MVLVLAALWWTFSWDGKDGATEPAARATPAAETSPSPSTSAKEHDLTEPAGVDTRPWDDIDACDDAVLPATMLSVVEDIWAEGPYDHPDRDGTRFGNYEGYLPNEDTGYFREFTVETLGLDHRGARRIVTGGWGDGDPDVWYDTEDHDESFCEFTP